MTIRTTPWPAGVPCWADLSTPDVTAAKGFYKVEPVVADSTVAGPLSCTGNSPAPINLGAANTVSGPATCQCAALD